MLAESKTYSEYKDIGQPWVGAVPAHWRVERGKRLFIRMQRPARDDDQTVTCFRDGVVTLRKNRRLRGFTEALKEIGYQGVRAGDLVIHAMDAFAGAIGVSDSDGKGSPVYQVCQPREGVNAKYYAFLVREMSRSQWIMALAKGIRERSTDFRYETFGGQFLPVPPPAEQAGIVRFLGAVDRKVNRFIRAKRRLIEVLTEQKQAIITHAVTKGLNPHAPGARFKPSGIDWHGDVPAHWEVRRLRTLVSRIDQGVSPQAENRLADADGAWGVLKAGCVNRGVFRAAEHKRLPDGFVVDASLRVNAGDVLVSRACGSPDLVGSVAQVTACPYRLILSDKTFRPVFKSQKHVAFLVYAMNSSLFRRQVRLAISGAEGLANNLPLSSLRDFVLTLPPPEEAAAIAHALSEMLTENSTAIGLAEREIDLIREYRTRLVAEVVTGKLDVRSAAASLPDEAPDSIQARCDEEAVDDADGEEVQPDTQPGEECDAPTELCQ